ncbi:EAL domain-containing protein [Citrobacter sp. FDAARGOS_156]|uniref:EAL domain-containing protein n=1 Tax=Citrobacter TaxID=544 RepID=UPI00076B3F43|nr:MULTISPECIES: EAL domain-containing protein [Citrobacter]AMH14332.1 EAL domain-containing protein [Citrobacter sp. FDAARGOS_156]EIS7448680.1 EAL domain-containing protein [Citrobacter youngae]MBJ8742081.1 EAL domain-containing protein [Citrobacter sp. FDAARGOS_156]MBJ8957862.1 EAL domain-containing protein [Citrobacter youngae]MBJ9160538.1 EAL domain-containing protein [Citrobacter sp. FDAARGOS_156]
MIVSLDYLYHSEFSFLPARSEKGDLEFVDIVTNFVSPDGDVHMPTELVMPRMSDDEQCRLFAEKLELIETCQHFFIQRKIPAWINLTPAVANILLSDAEYASRVERFSFIELTINESYPELNSGKENPTLAALAARFPLILTNYGAGGISTRAIFDGLFKRVVLDKNFVQQRITHISFEPFMRAILAQLSPCCESIIISGIDTQEMLTRVLPLGFSAMQGGLWPAVSPAKIISLVK